MGTSQSYPARENHDPSVSSTSSLRPSQQTLPTNNPPWKGDIHSQSHLTKIRPGPTPFDSSLQSPVSLSPPQVPSPLPTLKFGSYSAAAGLFLGSFYGILRSNRPISFSLATGIQWGLAGTSFHGVRSFALYSLTSYWHDEDLRTKGSRPRLVADVLASAAAGGVVGATSGGIRSVGPGAFIFSVVGLGGHWINEKRLEKIELQPQQTREKREEQEEMNMSWIGWATTRKWSPLRMLSDEEYREILLKKLARVEAEIAVLEDDVKAIREKDGRGDS